MTGEQSEGNVVTGRQGAGSGTTGEPEEVGGTTGAVGEGSRVAAGSVTPAYRIEDLARLSGATVRTVRAYQDRGLLPRAERRGRANLYSGAHLVRLRQIADLLDRGYTLASIKELLQAWDTGRGLGGVLGLVAEVDGPGTTGEEAARISRAELDVRFGGTPDDAAVADASDLQNRQTRTRTVSIPEETMLAVESLVGAHRSAEFIALAAEREVRARALDRLAASNNPSARLGQTP